MPQPPPTPSTRVIGILGGIASGKTWVARRIAGSSGIVVDADEIAREVLELPEVRQELVRAFGAAILRPDGSPDRARLAQRVFASPAERARLEGFTHPRIRARIRALLDQARARGIPRVVLDVPLLIENEPAHGLVSECHELVFVDSAPAARDARAVASRGWESGEVGRREALQMPLADKRARAHYVIENFGDLADLEAAVERYLARDHASAFPERKNP